MHHQLGANTSKALETASFLYALIELLMKKGLLTEGELNAQKVEVAQRLVEKFREPRHRRSICGIADTTITSAKTKCTIDCENRLPLCKAACCRLTFALSRQDIEEGIVKWDLGRPYMIAHDADGYCRHLDRQACRCSVYANRPVPCRAYDCRKDKRIWTDFDKGIINPTLEELFRNGEHTNGSTNAEANSGLVQLHREHP